MHYPVIFIPVSLILLLLVLVLLIKVRVLVEYTRKWNDDNIVISFFALRGLLKLKYEIPLVNVGKKGIKLKRVTVKGKKEKEVEREKTKFGLKELIENAKNIKYTFEISSDIVDYLKKHVVLNELNLKMRIGTGDAFYTGIFTGLAWAAAGILISYLEQNIRIVSKCVNIGSDFAEKDTKVDLYCIFGIKLVHIIGMRLILLFKNIRIKHKFNRGAGGDVSG